MMKKILYAVCLLVVLFTITACGSKIKGNYKMVEMSEDGISYNEEVLSTLGLDFKLTVDDDKAILNIMNTNTVYTYDDNNFVSKDVETGNKEIVPYTINGDKLTLNKDNRILVFEKIQ